jgi:hypothetical protein
MNIFNAFRLLLSPRAKPKYPRVRASGVTGYQPSALLSNTPRPPPPVGRTRKFSPYLTMLKIIERTPALQSEWNRFSMLLKLSCEPDEIELLFPENTKD